MLAQPTEYLPFGRGNWPCLNPVCPHYQQPSISTVEIHYRHRGGNYPMGVFSCECGFTYSYLAPDRSSAGSLPRRKDVLAYGPLWEEKLKTLWLNPALSFRRIAAELRMDAGVMKRQAARLGLHATPDGRRWQSEDGSAPDWLTQWAARHSSKCEAYRTEWRTVLASGPDLKGAELLKKYNRLYQWLCRNDREWLLQNMPPTPEVQPHRRQINWAARDAELSVQIREIAMKLKLQTQSFCRVTKKILLKQELGQPLLLVQLDRLPQTALALEEAVETVDEYAVRRVWQVARMYCLEGVIPPPGKFAKRAGVAHNQHKPVIRNATITALALLNQPIPDYQAICTRLQEILGSPAEVRDS